VGDNYFIFITGLPKFKKQNDFIMVVVDKLSKLSHFIPVKSTHQTIEVEDIFMRDIFRLHIMSRVIVSHQDVKFTLAFWKSLFIGLGTQVHYNTSYHPHTEGKTEQVNQVVEDMLCMYVMQQPSKQEKYLDLVEFTYNNNYHESLKMSPYEVIYGKRFRVPFNLNSIENKLMLGLDMLKEIESTARRV